jgi:hypothetical protein
VSSGNMNTLARFDADLLAEMGTIKSAASFVLGFIKNVAVNVVLKYPVYLLSIRLPKSKIIFWGSFQKYRYSDMSLEYVHIIPLTVGSAVEVLQTSVSPKYIKANRSNCRPLEVTVKFMTTRLNLHAGGV